VLQVMHVLTVTAQPRRVIPKQLDRCTAVASSSRRTPYRVSERVFSAAIRSALDVFVCSMSGAGFFSPSASEQNAYSHRHVSHDLSVAAHRVDGLNCNFPPASSPLT